MWRLIKTNRLLARIALSTAARRLAESRNRVPAVPYGGPYGGTFVRGGWTR